MYAFSPHPAYYYRPVYQRPRPYYGYSSPFAFEELPYWLSSPPLGDHHFNDGSQEHVPLPFEHPATRLIHPTLQHQRQVIDNQNQAAASPPGNEPTLLFISPNLQQQKHPEPTSDSPSKPAESSEAALDPSLLLLSPLLQKLVLDKQKVTPSTPPPSPAVQEIVPRGTERESDDKFVVRVHLPDGTTADNVKVRVRDNVLSVMGRTSETTADSMAVATSFSRQWSLGKDIDTDNVTAVIEQDGTLVITAPKKVKVKEVPVVKSAAVPANASKDSQTQSPSTNVAAPSMQKTTSLPKTKEPVAAKKKETTQPPSPPAISKSKKAKVKETTLEVPFELRITQNDNAKLVVTVQIPQGVSPDDLNMEVKDRVLNISGLQRKQVDGSVFTTKFERHLVLDEHVETEKMEATMDAEKRLLTVSAPKKPPLVKPAQKIAIHMTPIKDPEPAADEGDSTASTAPSDVSSATETSITSEAKEEVPTSINSNNESISDDSNGHVKIALEEQESPEGTKIVVETVAEE